MEKSCLYVCLWEDFVLAYKPTISLYKPTYTLVNRPFSLAWLNMC